jgi:hypothetical protein
VWVRVCAFEKKRKNERDRSEKVCVTEIGVREIER